jgi:hypothetical protein
MVFAFLDTLDTPTFLSSPSTRRAHRHGHNFGLVGSQTYMHTGLASVPCTFPSVYLLVSLFESTDADIAGMYAFLSTTIEYSNAFF